MRMLLFALLAAVMLSLPVWAETTVILKDGRRLTGQVIESSDTVGVVTSDGLQTVRRADIERIEYDAFGRATRPQLTAYRAAERAADRVAHPAEAIVVWKEYLDRNQTDNPLVAEAEKQLLRWQEAVKDGKLVWAGKLVTPQDRERLRQQASLKLEQAVAAYRMAQFDRALAMLREADRDWPGHPGVAFYTALTLQKNRKPQEAAKLYRKILENYPDHVPTLNNLAVSECLQRQFAVGVPLMLRALTLGGDVVLINDNAWKTLVRASEAKLRGFEGETAKIESILNRFETVMQQQGLYRWGSAWIPAEKFKNIEAANRESEKKSVDLLDEKQVKPIVDMVMAGIMGVEVAQKMLGLDPAANKAGASAEADYARAAAGELCDSCAHFDEEKNHCRARKSETTFSSPACRFFDARIAPAT